MNLTRFSSPLIRLTSHSTKTHCYLSTDRPETISAALKRFYLKLHPDLFTQHPKEKVTNHFR
jgi:hypothetical protein